MATFSQLRTVKNPIFGAAQTKIGPSYFVRALVQFPKSYNF